MQRRTTAALREIFIAQDFIELSDIRAIVTVGTAVEGQKRKAVRLTLQDGRPLFP
jgi:hypothetical protein